MNDLLKQSTIDFKHKVPRQVGRRLPLMREESELALREGNYKKAFIFLKRWLNTAEWIKSTRPYKDDPAYYNETFSIDKEHEVRALFADVEAKVKESLVPPQIKSEIEQKADRKDKNLPTDGILNLPETPTDEPLAKELEEFTTCLQLFDILKDPSRILIIDVRSREDYMESRIKTNRCINIPPDKVCQGILAHTLQKLFTDDSEAGELFRKRDSRWIKLIVLLDWTTTAMTFFPENKLRILKNILENWDLGAQPTKITILDGGYVDWLNRYPSSVTNPKVRPPEITNDEVDEFLDEVKYPEWLNSDDTSNLFNQLRIKPLGESESNKRMDNHRADDVITKITTKDLSPSIMNEPIMNSNGNAYTKVSSRNDINNVMEIKEPYKLVIKKMSEISKYSNRGKTEKVPTEDMSIDEDEPIFESSKLANDSILNNLKPKPKVDRSSKPAKTSSLAGKLLTLKSQLNDLLKNLEQSENKILWIESEIYQQDENDNRTVNEKLNRDHVKACLNTLNADVNNLRKLKDQVKEALANESMKNVPLNPPDKNKICQLDLSIGSYEQRLKSISIKRKTLKEKIMNKEKEKMNSYKINENSVTKEPLRSDGSSANTGLKRSHSSPNIVRQVKKLKLNIKLDDGKIPVIDRSSKPRATLEQVSNKATNGVNSKLASKDREQRLEPIFRDTRPGITGLKNLGNSCYMNSIIQCLSNNIRLAKYFNEDAYLDDLNKSLNICKQGQVADEVANVIKALWRGQYKSISPRDLKVVIGQYRLQFDCNEQQDSHEFLVFLLDWLHNDLKKAVDYYLGRISIAKKQWFKSLNNGESIISELFMGQLKSSIICNICDHSSITYETFNSLTLSLPNTNRCTLDVCIKKFVTGQKVSGWTCDNCKVPRDATKKFDFIKLPPTVVIHLNRFADNDGWLQKSNTSVDFPLSDLNLATYLVDDESNDDSELQYDFHRMSLYAVSVHYGTMSGGHYTAYCRNGGQHKWYKYDDQLVSEVSPSDVKNQGTSAYLLFYTTIGSESYPYIQRAPMMKLGRL